MSEWKPSKIGLWVRRFAIWVAFKFVPVDDPRAKAYTQERMNSDFIEDEVTIRRAMECYFWIRQIVDGPTPPQDDRHND